MHPRHDGFHDLAADILEVDVDAVRRRGGKLLAPVRRLVVDGGVEAEILDNVPALVGPARDADGAATLDLRDLADDRADGARCSGDEDGVTRLRAAKLKETEIGGEAGHAAGAEHGRQFDGKALRQHAHGAHAFIGDAVVLPAGEAAHPVAFLVARRVRLHDHADAAAAHDLADADGRHVLVHVAHPDAVRGIEAEIEHAHDRLAGTGLGNRLLDEIEIRLLDAARGARLQAEPAVDVVLHGDGVLRRLR